MWGGTKPTARRSLSQPGADSSLYAREPAPLSPLRRHLPPGEGKETLPGGGKLPAENPPEAVVAASGGEERKESGLLVVPVVVDETAVGDTLGNWECYTRMKGVGLIR